MIPDLCIGSTRRRLVLRRVRDCSSASTRARHPKRACSAVTTDPKQPPTSERHHGHEVGPKPPGESSTRRVTVPHHHALPRRGPECSRRHRSYVPGSSDLASANLGPANRTTGTSVTRRFPIALRRQLRQRPTSIRAGDSSASHRPPTWQTLGIYCNLRSRLHSGPPLLIHLTDEPDHAAHVDLLVVEV